jgi:hypothetical protein
VHPAHIFSTIKRKTEGRVAHLWRPLIEHITLATAFVAERNTSDE